MHIIIYHPILIASLQESPAGGGSGFFTSVTNMSPLSYAILFVLFIFSLFSWAIILQKWLSFRRIERQSEAFVAFFHKSTRLSEVNLACEHYRGTPLVGLFLAAYQELNAQIQSTKSKSSELSANPGHPSLGDRNLSGIQRALLRASAAELSVLEKSMSWIATTAAVTPFIGLLGTVIGIISAFTGLGSEKTTSIQAVAPGIAEALVATAAGLFAAIPAVIAYNQFLQRIKTVAAEMDDFSAEFLNIVERSFM